MAGSTTTSDACIVGGKHHIPLGAGGRPALLLVRIGAVLGEIADEQLAAAGVNGADYGILAVLASDGPGSQQELAELLGKAPGLMVAAIDDLEERGLVARVRDPADRRRSRVTVTAAGEKALRHADQLADQAVADLFPGLGKQERSELGRLLERGVTLTK
jgi:MarR family transcriptional regulator, lower aerobic nicotinate degradation pathway regulator